MDPSGNRKLDKIRAVSRIDAMVAAVMASFPLLSGLYEGPIVFDELAWIG
jgi:hypothetical protein